MLAEIICIIDKSGSMQSIVNDAIGGFNAFIEAQKEVEGEANLSLVLFNTYTEVVYENIDIKKVKPLDKNTYVPNGGTALLDAVGVTIDRVGKRIDKLTADKKPDKVIVAILTDGEENSSVSYKLDAIKSMITHQTEKYSWEFIFLAANQDAFLEGSRLGINAINTYSFGATSKGTSKAYTTLSDVVTSYRA